MNDVSYLYPSRYTKIGTSTVKSFKPMKKSSSTQPTSKQSDIKISPEKEINAIPSSNPIGSIMKIKEKYLNTSHFQSTTSDKVASV